MHANSLLFPLSKSHYASPIPWQQQTPYSVLSCRSSFPHPRRGCPQMSVPEYPNDPTPIPENNPQDNATVSPITSFTNSADETLSAESDPGITNSPSASPLKSIGPY